MGQHTMDDVGVVVDPELIGHSQQQRIGRGDGLILGEFGDDLVRLPA